MKSKNIALALFSTLALGLSITNQTFAMEKQENSLKKTKTNSLEKLSTDVLCDQILSTHFNKQELGNLRLVNKEFKNAIKFGGNGAFTQVSYAPNKNIPFGDLLNIAITGVITQIYNLDLTKPLQLTDQDKKTIETRVEAIRNETNKNTAITLRHNFLQDFSIAQRLQFFVKTQKTNPKFTQYLTHKLRNLSPSFPRFTITAPINTVVRFKTILPNKDILIRYSNNTSSLYDSITGQQKPEQPTQEDIAKIPPYNPSFENFISESDDSSAVTLWDKIPEQELDPLKAALLVKLQELKIQNQKTRLHPHWLQIYRELPNYAKNELGNTIDTNN